MELQLAISAFAALAQETRLEVFRILVQAGPQGVPAGSVAAALGVPSATLSFHLKELKSAGLVRYERQGRLRIYSPNFSVVNELIAFLTANCCQGVEAAGSANTDCGLGGTAEVQTTRFG